MDASEAREHLEMVERIVAMSSRRLEAGGEFFVVWGLVAAGIDATLTAARAGFVPVPAFYVTYGVLLAAGIAFSVLRSAHYRRCSDQMSFLQHEYFKVLWLTLGLVSIVMLTTFRIFNTTAQMALWSFAETFVLLYIGMHGNRRALAAGIVILASLVAANFMYAAGGWILAAGALLGYAGFGVAEMLARE